MDERGTIPREPRKERADSALNRLSEILFCRTGPVKPRPV